tara:strand:+ start:6977 stop:7885 length:909 start_codon:yes stop_codon:yes gene_type:complete
VDAQTHAEEHYEYDRLHKTMKGYYNRGLYHKAVLYPDSLKSNKYVDATSYYFFARIYSLSNEFDKTLFNLEKAVKGGITKTQIEQMYDLDGFRESNMHILYESNYDKWHEEYLVAEQGLILDSIYYRELDSMNILFTKLGRELWVKIIKDSVIYSTDSVGRYVARIREDSLFYEMTTLIIKNGFPTKKRIGEIFYKVSRNVRHQMPDDYDVENKDWFTIKAMIFAEMKTGKLKPFYYALIEDRIELNKNKVQKFGTIPYNLKFKNPEELNIRRKAVGLCSIQLEMWSEARELPKSLKEVNFK